MSESEVGGSPMALPAADLLIRSVEAGDERERLPWLAMIAAALLHALVLLWLLIDWSRPVILPPEPRVVPVQIVMAPPPSPPPPAAPPAPKPAPAPAFRESGPDQRTTAPPPAEKPAPQPAAPPPPAPEQKTPETEAPPPSPPPEKPAVPQESGKPVPPKDVPRPEPQKQEAAIPVAPHPAPLRRLDVEPGERVETGDPYLNQLYTLIERHRVYPRVIGPLGLAVEGTAVYDVALDRSGKIVAMRLERSSGVAGIDQAVAGMIRSSLPFPPLPPDYPDEVGIVVTIRLFPPS